MSNYKAIVIDVKPKSVPNGSEERWEDITTHMPILTRDIKTPALDANSDLTSVVSGMPTVFARANLFKLAIDYVQAPDKDKDESDGLINFYKNLVDEWRGFIACLALDYTRIEIRRIKLSYSDGKDFAETDNIYEPKGAFGNVLFERKKLWMKQGASAVSDDAPFIDVVLYEGNREDERNVIGAVSPESLLFTSPSYKITSDHPFVNKNTRKFTDPLKSALSQDEALTLLAYVEYVETQINRLGNYYGGLSEDIRPNYATVQGNIRNWKEEIRAYCNRHDFDLNAKSIPPVDKFQEPYDLVFNYSSKLYGLEGIIYDDESSAPHNKILFDPKNILLPKNSEIARIDFSNNEITKNPSLLEEQPVYVLKAQIKGKDGEYAFFALPITPLGLNVFGKNIGALTGIDANNAIRSKLTAIYDQESPIDNLEVVLEVTTQSGKRKTLKESYTVKWDRISNKDIMLWPNFISEKWNRYFLYSEMPHNAQSQNCPFKATPIVGSYKDNDFRIIVDDETKEPVLLADNGKISLSERIKRETGLEAKFHVISDNRVSDNDYKYEIYESNLPFKGVKLSSGNKESGYLVIRYTTSDNKHLPKSELGQGRQLREASVGIDFGSTNTSVAYSVEGELKSIFFHNHRISLLQAGKRSICKERDLFFFQNKELEGNAIKSILTLNDPRRFVQGDHAAQSKEVSGGMPCFDPSLLPVETVKENRILLKYADVGQIQLVHNMKWTTSDEDKNHKKAFLRSLMLHIYSQLYVEGCVPTKLKWSYPSSMGDVLVNQYSQIWKDLSVDLSPIKGVGLAICDSDIVLEIASDPQTGWQPTAPTGNGWGTTTLNQDGWGNQTDSNTWESQQEKQTDGWGNQASQPTGWGNQQEQPNNAYENQQPSSSNIVPPLTPDLEPDTNEVVFDFQKIDPTKCMTEACAVANFMMTQDIRMTNKSLTLCFDVGGSTTDISALLFTTEGLTMIKQNSIKFAAQRVSKAAQYEPNLKKVLGDLCEQFKIKIPGLNIGPDKYSSETASFYFEQVLDRFPTNELTTLYSAISAQCPTLMSINLYVTGLIVYYAGQLTNKLIKVIRKSLGKTNPLYSNFTPNVNVMFAGKGARIFEWFSTTQHNAAQQYFSSMFINGMGGIRIAQSVLFGPPSLQLLRGASNDVKYEVSKGLALNAQRSIRVPKNSMEAIEILGEDNFVITKASNFQEIPLSFDNAITTQMMSQIGQYFQQNQPANTFACTKFADFAYLFYQTSTRLFGLKLSQNDFIEGFNNMNIDNYIMNLPEYRNALEAQRASGGTKFDFVSPIIILEGMKFYDDFLLKKL